MNHHRVDIMRGSSDVLRRMNDDTAYTCDCCFVALFVFHGLRLFGCSGTLHHVGRMTLRVWWTVAWLTADAHAAAPRRCCLYLPFPLPSGASSYGHGMV